MIQGPDVSNIATDSRTGIRFDVLAYRKLSEAELMAFIRHWYRTTPRSKWPKKGRTAVIMTVLD